MHDFNGHSAGGEAGFAIDALSLPFLKENLCG